MDYGTKKYISVHFMVYGHKNMLSMVCDQKCERFGLGRTAKNCKILLFRVYDHFGSGWPPKITTPNSKSVTQCAVLDRLTNPAAMKVAFLSNRPLDCRHKMRGSPCSFATTSGQTGKHTHRDPCRLQVALRLSHRRWHLCSEGNLLTNRCIIFVIFDLPPTRRLD